VKLGTENTKMTVAAGALFVLAIAMFIHMISGSSGSSSAPSPAAAPQPATTQTRRATPRKGAHVKAEKTAAPVTTSLDPRLHLSALKESEDTEYEGKGRNIFMATEEPKTVDIPKAQGSGLIGKSTPPPPPPPPKPQPPPINLKFFGFASGPDHKHVFLSQGDDVFVAAEGDIVQRRYKIVKINNNTIEVLDVLSNNRQTIPLTAG
jgi:hypothetical protein